MHRSALLIVYVIGILAVLLGKICVVYLEYCC